MICQFFVSLVAGLGFKVLNIRFMGSAICVSHFCRCESRRTVVEPCGSLGGEEPGQRQQLPSCRGQLRAVHMDISSRSKTGPAFEVRHNCQKPLEVSLTGSAARWELKAYLTSGDELQRSQSSLQVCGVGLEFVESGCDLGFKLAWLGP